MVNLPSVVVVIIICVLLFAIEAGQEVLIDLTKNYWIKFLIHFVGRIFQFLIPLAIVVGVYFVWGLAVWKCTGGEDRLQFLLEEIIEWIQCNW